MEMARMTVTIVIMTMMIHVKNKNTYNHTNKMINDNLQMGKFRVALMFSNTVADRQISIIFFLLIKDQNHDIIILLSQPIMREIRRQSALFGAFPSSKDPGRRGRTKNEEHTSVKFLSLICITSIFLFLFFFLVGGGGGGVERRGKHQILVSN